MATGAALAELKDKPNKEAVSAVLANDRATGPWRADLYNDDKADIGFITSSFG